MPQAFEVNFDAIVGPTHNYAGLAWGNLASMARKNRLSSPRDAALQGLAKMKLLADLGFKQAVLPPQQRPAIFALRRVGFSGTDAQILEKARREAPAILAACSSASAMWAANAATVSPGADTADGRVHFTPANLANQFHRSLEPLATAAALRAIFADESAFAHHLPLPAAPLFCDEGAANHLRLCAAYGEPGIEIFAYGHAGADGGASRFPARQTLEASRAVARLHGLDERRTLFFEQNPAAIDAGAFHSDVVAVANGNVLLMHTGAFTDAPELVARLRRAYGKLGGGELHVIEASEPQVPLADAVGSYLFNSQLLTQPSGQMMLLAPAECQTFARVRAFLDDVIAGDNPITSVRFADVRQSMNNGGGPACLRLRVVLTDVQITKLKGRVLLNDALYAELVAWVRRRYRPSLAPDDLADPKLLEESRAALDELSGILKLGSVYPFQA